MIAEITALSAVGVGLSALTAWALHRPHLPFSWRELHLPEELSDDVVEALLRHVAGVQQGPVLFVVSADAGRLRFLLGAAERTLGSVAAAASGLIPELRIEEAGPEDALALDISTSLHCHGVRLGWGGPWPMLRVKDPALTAAGLLGALASVERGERLLLMVRVWPAGRVHRPAAASERGSVAPNPWFLRPWWPAEPPREELTAIRAKFGGLLLRSEIVIVARASRRLRATALAHRVIAALRTAGGSRGVLRWRGVHGQERLQRVLSQRRAPLPWELKTLLSPEELTGLIGLPIEAPRVAGITYGAGPRLIPATAMPTTGRVFARSTWPASSERLLVQPIEGGLQHAAIVGPTGSGKSTLVGSLVVQDMEAGRGSLVLDLKGDLVNDLLARVPLWRQRDVIVLEPALSGPQPGLQLFPTDGETELTADLVLGTLREMFADSWGVRSSQYLGLGLRTLAALPDATLLQLPWLFSEGGLRSKALARVRDPWLIAAWERFDGLSAADRSAQLAAPLNKIEELLSRRRVRAVLGQEKPQLDFREVLARGRVVLVSLPPGLLGAPATRLLAALTLWQFFQAVEARAALQPDRRRPFMCYVDEVSVLASLPLPLEGLLERARGHGVGLTLAPQALSQLSPPLRASLLANVGSLVAFQQTSEEEANVMAKALPGVNTSQLQHLGQFEVALRLSLRAGLVTPTMTGRTAAPAAASSDPAVIRKASAERYGQAAEDIDRAMAARHGIDPNWTGKRPGGVDWGELGVTRRRP